MAEVFEWAGGGELLFEVLSFLGNLGYQYLCWSEWWGLGVGKYWQVKVAGERVFMDHLECMGDVWIGC